MGKKYDIVHVGHYTKDTIISKTGTRIVDGGGFNYGAHATKALGLNVAAVTRLSKTDKHVLKEIKDFGIHVYAKFTPKSTCLTIEYPTDNPDERIFRAESSAGLFTPKEIKKLKAKAFVAAPSFKGEMDVAFMKSLKDKAGLLALDIQGFIRVFDEQGNVKYEKWETQDVILPMLDIFKVDIAEAEYVTGSNDRHKAAKILKDLGPKEIILTHKSGVLVYDGKKYYEAEFMPKQLIGRSGRGDTCVSTYTACRISMEPDQAIKYTAALTSLKMEKEGPFDRTRKEVEDFIKDKY